MQQTQKTKDQTQVLFNEAFFMSDENKELFRQNFNEAVNRNMAKKISSTMGSKIVFGKVFEHQLYTGNKNDHSFISTEDESGKTIAPVVVYGWLKKLSFYTEINDRVDIEKNEKNNIICSVCKTQNIVYDGDNTCTCKNGHRFEGINVGQWTRTLDTQLTRGGGSGTCTCKFVDDLDSILRCTWSNIEDKE